MTLQTNHKFIIKICLNQPNWGEMAFLSPNNHRLYNDWFIIIKSTSSFAILYFSSWQWVISVDSQGWKYVSIVDCLDNTRETISRFFHIGLVGQIHLNNNRITKTGYLPPPLPEQTSRPIIKQMSQSHLTSQLGFVFIWVDMITGYMIHVIIQYNTGWYNLWFDDNDDNYYKIYIINKYNNESEHIIHYIDITLSKKSTTLSLGETYNT